MMDEKNNEYNIFGEEQKNFYDLFNEYANYKQKKTIRINISIIDKILNKKIKSFLNKNAFLQQLIINNRSVLFKQSGKNIFI